MPGLGFRVQGAGLSKGSFLVLSLLLVLFNGFLCMCPWVVQGREGVCKVSSLKGPY